MKTGMVASEGRQPARGLTPAVWYSLAVSTCSHRTQKGGVVDPQNSKRACSRPLYH